MLSLPLSLFSSLHRLGAQCGHKIFLAIHSNNIIIITRIMTRTHAANKHTHKFINKQIVKVRKHETNKPPTTLHDIHKHLRAHFSSFVSLPPSSMPPPSLALYYAEYIYIYSRIFSETDDLSDLLYFFIYFTFTK